jgi:hypothetical protein
MVTLGSMLPNSALVHALNLNGSTGAFLGSFRKFGKDTAPSITNSGNLSCYRSNQKKLKLVIKQYDKANRLLCAASK